ncbi:MAG TPA: TonB-dependent receptor [Vicinamibacterales bacterium]
MSAPGGVQGVVTDPDGSRVRGARVILVGHAAVASAVLSDAVGRFRIERVPAGQYELRVSADGFRADPVAVAVDAGRDADVPVRLHVSAVSESVVVSAAQVELPLARAADSVSIVSARELRALQAETVADAMRAVPGLSISRNGGRGGVTSVFPRGGESDFTLVLVDGIKANAFGGGYDFSALSAADVERIEVVRGPESALFGADAMGAVVQVITRRGGSPRVEGSIESGSLRTTRLTAGSWGSRGAWNWGGSAERLSSDGFTGIAPATGETVSNDDFLMKHASLSGGWHAPGGSDVRGTFTVTSGDRGFPGPFGSNPIDAYTSVDRMSRGATTTWQYGARWLQPISSGSRHIRQTSSLNYLDLHSDFASSYGLSASTTSRLGVRTQTDVDLSGALGLSAGVELQREQATSTFITAGSTGPVPIRRRVIGGFAEARIQPSSRLTLTAGVRAEQVQRDRLGSNPDPYAPRPAFDTDTRVSVNPRMSAALFLPGLAGPRGWLRLHAAAGTGMRAPDALEIAFTDNPGLKPERSRSVEGGADHAFLGETLVVGATVFFNRYDDLIVAIGPALKDASRYRTDNISNAQSRGAELSAAMRARWGLAARASYTFLDTEILAVDRLGTAPPPFKAGDPLLRRPRHLASFDLTMTRGKATAFARVGGRGRTLDVEPSYGTYGGLFDNPGYTVVDAGLTWRVGQVVELFGRVGNLLDRRYEETFGFPALGRNATIGVRVAAGR